MNAGLLFMVIIAAIVVTLAVVMSTHKGRKWMLGEH